MVFSHGGISGGLTIADALREFEARGYVGQFMVQRGGTIECRQCGHTHLPAEVSLEAMRRIEGVSDPADMAFIGALKCPHCGQQGTAILTYGPTAPPEHAEVLRELENRRPSSEITRRSVGEDSSLVSDSGWLRGPED